MTSRIFSGERKTFSMLLDEMTKDGKPEETLESILAELKALEADSLVRLADEEQELRECLREIRDVLRRKQQRGKALEAMGVTLELVRRYRKDYGETDWGC